MSGNGTNYMPLYPGDVLAATVTWTGEERALLLLVLMYLWVTPLPADEKEVARITGFGDRFDKVWKRVSTCFENIDGFLWHRDLEAHRERAHRLHEQRVNASNKAALARAMKPSRRTNGGSPSGDPIGDPHG